MKVEAKIMAGKEKGAAYLGSEKRRLSEERIRWADERAQQAEDQVYR